MSYLELRWEACRKVGLSSYPRFLFVIENLPDLTGLSCKWTKTFEAERFLPKVAALVYLYMWWLWRVYLMPHLYLKSFATAVRYQLLPSLRLVFNILVLLDVTSGTNDRRQKKVKLFIIKSNSRMVNYKICKNLFIWTIQQSRLYSKSFTKIIPHHRYSYILTSLSSSHPNSSVA